MSNDANSGAGDQAASGSDPAWPDPSKMSRGYQPYEPPYPMSGYQYGSQQGYAHPPQGPRSRISVGTILGLAALLATIACALGLFIAYLL
jgi:hypothetical protein